MSTDDAMNKPGLRETVERLTREAADRRRQGEERDGRLKAFAAAFDLLFHRIRGVYLLEFLMFDLVRIESAGLEVPVVGLGSLATELVRIAVAEEVVEIRPFHSLARPSSISVAMTHRGSGSTHEFRFDTAAASPGWAAPVRETGLRRLVESYLPERWVPLDETIFKAHLDDLLAGPHPSFGMGRNDVGSGLSHLLDVVTSDEGRRSLGLGVRSGVSRLARGVSLTAPRVGRSALKALPRLARTPLLLADLRKSPGPRSDTDGADP